MLCSSFSSIHQEILFLKSVLKLNGYPLALIDCCIEKFLNRIYPSRPLIVGTVDTVAKKSALLAIPFTGSSSPRVGHKIRHLCRKFSLRSNVELCLKPSIRLANFFSFKVNLPDSL